MQDVVRWCEMKAKSSTEDWNWLRRLTSYPKLVKAAVRPCADVCPCVDCCFNTDVADVCKSVECLLSLFLSSVS